MTTLLEYDGFYDAARARQIALGQASGNSDVLTEINALQGLIDSAAASSNLQVIVTGITPMTNSNSFFFSWNDPFNNDTATDRLNRAKMDAVINYFTRLGFYVKRKRVGITDFFEWSIEW